MVFRSTLEKQGKVMSGAGFRQKKIPPACPLVNHQRQTVRPKSFRLSSGAFIMTNVIS